VTQSPVGRNPFATLCRVVGVIFAAWGAMMIPTGLFVGPQVLSGAAIGLGFGCLFWITGAGVRAGKRWAFLTAILLPLVCVSLSIFAGVQSMDGADSAPIVVWSFVASFFAIFSMVSLRERIRYVRRERIAHAPAQSP
jgi:hypothetical protein